MMEPNGPPASAFETAAIEPRKIAPIAAQCFMPAPAKTKQYYCELQSECKVSFCSQRVWGRKKRAGGKMRVFLVAGGEGVSQSPLKGKAFSALPSKNPLFELRPEGGLRLHTSQAGRRPIERASEISCPSDHRRTSVYSSSFSTPIF